MPLPLTISCSSKSRLVLPSWLYLSGASSPGWSLTKSKRAVKWLCVCLYFCGGFFWFWFCYLGIVTIGFVPGTCLMKLPVMGVSRHYFHCLGFRFGLESYCLGLGIWRIRWVISLYLLRGLEGYWNCVVCVLNPRGYWLGLEMFWGSIFTVLVSSWSWSYTYCFGPITINCTIHCVSKNDTDVAHCNFNTHQPILVIFGRDVAERVCYWMMIYYPTSPN